MSTVTDIAKEKIIIVGRNYGNILAMTRAMGRAGYDVCILRLYKSKPRKLNLIASMKPDAHSKYAFSFEECVVGENQEKAVNALIKLNSGEKRLLLIPVDDYSCGIIDENISALRAKYIIPGISDEQGTIKKLMDKQLQKQLAADSGLPVLKSTLIKSQDNSYSIPADVPFPCFVKPNISMNDTKAKMARCDDKEQLDLILCKYAAKGDFELLAEEFADIKHEYSLLGVSDGENILIPGIFRAECGGHRERKGVAMTGIVENTERFGLFIDKCSKYIRALRFKGLFDIDIIETADDEIYFIEVNFRAGASVHAFTESGINMPGIFADRILKGLPMHINAQACKGSRFLSEKILLEEFARNDVTLKELKHHLRSADILFVKDSDDPEPYSKFKKYYFIAWLMRLPYRIRDSRKRK